MVIVSGYGERERSFPSVTVPRGLSERERIFPSVTGPEEAMWSEDNPGVCPGKTFVMRPSRWGGSVGGCVWLERCVLMMSSWDDGDTYMCGLPWSAVGDSVNGPCGMSTGSTRRCDAEEIAGAVLGLGAALEPIQCFELLLLEVPEADASNLNVTLASMSSWACFQNFGEEFHHDPEVDIDEIALDGAVFGGGAAVDLMWSVVHMWDVRSETVVDGRKDQSTEKELDWNIVKGKKSKSSTAKMPRSTEGGKSNWDKPSSLPRNSVPEGEHFSRKGPKVPVEKAAIVKQKVPELQEAPVMRVVVGGKERTEEIAKSDVQREGFPSSPVKHEVHAEQVVLEKQTKAKERTEDVAKSDVQREGFPSKGGAVFEFILPGVDVGATREKSTYDPEAERAGGTVPGNGAALGDGAVLGLGAALEPIQCFEHLLLEVPKASASNLNATLESTVQMFLQSELQKLPIKIIVETPPLAIHESLVTTSSWACCQNFGDESHHDPEADIDEIALDGAVFGVGAALDHPWSIVRRCDAEEIDGAVTGVGAALDHPWSVVTRCEADSSSYTGPIWQALVEYVSYPKPKVLRGHLTWRAGHINRVRV